MFRTLKDTKRGFTLIELLVVIAIIGILSSVVLASLSTAREKARDSKRVSDVEQIKLALELQYDSTSTYVPSDANNNTTVVNGGGNVVAEAVQTLVDRGYLPRVPVGPNGDNYIYAAVTTTNGNTQCTATSAGQLACLGYVVAIDFERTDSPLLRSDDDSTIGTVINGGATASCSSAVAGTEKCYGARP